VATPSAIPLPLTGDNAIDASMNGYYWNLDSSRTIRWAVSGGKDGEFWSNPSAIASNIDAIFSNISYYADVEFSYVGSFATPTQASPYSDITISLSASTSFFPSKSIWGRAYFPDASYNGAYSGAPGDVFLNINSLANSLPTYAPGSAGYFLFMHEIGHALGLKHPHDGGGTGRPTLESLGLSALNKDWFTIMSYEDDYNLNLRTWDPATPMPIDVMGLQYLYGPNTSTNATDTVYTLPITNDYATVWDAGGVDRIDVSSSAVGWSILMPAIQFSSIIPTRTGFAAPSNEMALSSPHTLYWLMGDIEDAIGSRYVDTIQGTQLNNRMRGGGGNDVLDGGDGLDGAFYSGKRANFQITATIDGYLVADRVGAEGIDSVSHIERLIFSDIGVALDTTGPAGLAYRLYQAAFDRKPDVSGLGYWISHIDNGMSLQDMAWNFINSPEFKSLYGATQSNSAFVSKLYENILNRPGDSGGINYWVGMLDRNEISRHYLVAEFSESAENQAQVVGSIQSGIEYIPFIT
jgi:hypothetical protein